MCESGFRLRARCASCATKSLRNLLTLLKTIPPYRKPEIELFKVRVGNCSTEAGRRLLSERSPFLRMVPRISRR